MSVSHIWASRFLSALALAMVFFVVGCGDSASPAYLRVFHASPDAPNVDIAVDGVTVLKNVAYKTASDYLAISAGKHTINVYATGTTTNPVLSGSVTLAKKSYTTVAAVNFVAHLQVEVITDDNTPPTTGNIKLRLIHAAPAAPSVDIYVTAPGADLSTATPNFTNVPFFTVSSYISAPAGSYQVRITPTGTKTVVIDTGTVTLNAGQIRTGVALDDPKSEGPFPFTAILLSDLN